MSTQKRPLPAVPPKRKTTTVSDQSQSPSRRLVQIAPLQTRTQSVATSLPFYTAAAAAAAFAAHSPQGDPATTAAAYALLAGMPQQTPPPQSQQAPQSTHPLATIDDSIMSKRLTSATQGPGIPTQSTPMLPTSAQIDISSSSINNSISNNGSNAVSSDDRRRKRLERNRVAAKECRQKKKRYICQLEDCVSMLKKENAELREENNRLRQVFGLVKRGPGVLDHPPPAPISNMGDLMIDDVVENDEATSKEAA